MPDGDPRNRFAGAREEYDQATTEQQDEQDSTDGRDGPEGDDSNERKDSSERQDSTAGTDNTDSMESNGSMKAQRKSVQMYVPEDDKEGVERTWRDIETLANLADVDKPAKNDYYAALIRYGYDDLERIAEDIGLEGAYAEYGDVVESR